MPNKGKAMRYGPRGQENIYKMDPVPAQFGSGTCDECQRPLSIYNPHTTCNACRHRLTLMGTRRYWQRRKCVRRGSLMPDTIE